MNADGETRNIDAIASFAASARLEAVDALGPARSLPQMFRQVSSATWIWFVPSQVQKINDFLAVAYFVSSRFELMLGYCIHNGSAYSNCITHISFHECPRELLVVSRWFLVCIQRWAPSCLRRFA